MALNTFECKYLTPLCFKGLSDGPTISLHNAVFVVPCHSTELCLEVIYSFKSRELHSTLVYFHGQILFLWGWGIPPHISHRPLHTSSPQRLSAVDAMREPTRNRPDCWYFRDEGQ